MSDEVRLLTRQEIARGMVFDSPACAGHSQAISPKTRDRIKQFQFRYGASLSLQQVLEQVAPADTLKAFFPKPRYRLRMIVKAGVHVGYQVFKGDWLHHYQWFDGSQPPAPKFCAANRDGDCTHPGCPQAANWQASCPIPDYPEEG